MSSYFNTLKKYKNDYQISLFEYLFIAIHYPFFKLVWLSDYGSGFKMNIARVLKHALKHYKFPITLYLNNSKVKFYVNFQSDSIASFKEIFWGGEYHVKNKISNVKTIVDLGSNTGMATLDFLFWYRPERILCVEGNQNLVKSLKKIQSQLDKKYELIIENLCITGIYNGPVTFIVSDDHRTSRVVYGKENGGVLCQGASLRSLLDAHCFSSVDLLKIDIEGGEYDIIDNDKTIFLRFRDILIEIHGAEEKRIYFRNTLSQLGFELMETKFYPGHNCETSHFRRK